MKKDPKPAHQIAEERKEAETLAAEILRLTSNIPKHVMDAPGVMAARLFKERMSKARTVALSPQRQLHRLRAAMQDVHHYYKTDGA